MLTKVESVATLTNTKKSPYVHFKHLIIKAFLTTYNFLNVYV